MTSTTAAQAPQGWGFAGASLIHERIMATAERLADEFRETPFREASGMRLGLDRIRAESHVISIWGERGSGKSTMLAKAMESLDKKPRFTVLPPISPEFFGPADTLVNVFLASLADQFDGIVGADSPEPDKLALLELLQNTRRKAALNTLRPGELWTPGSPRLGEATREIQSIAGGTEGLWTDIQRLVARLATQRTDCDAIVVGIDDADLMRSDAVMQLVREARLLGSCRHLVVILAGQESEVRGGFLREALEDTVGLTVAGEMPPERRGDLEAVVSAQMRKAFPRSMSFTIESPTWEEQLAFRGPTGAPLRSLVLEASRVFLDDNRQPQFWLAEPGVGHAQVVIPGPFSPNLRNLAQLHTALAAGLPRLDGDDRVTRMRTVFELFLSTVDVPYGARQAPEYSFDLEGSTSTVRATIDFSGLRGIAVPGAWCDIDVMDTTSRPESYDLRPLRAQLGQWRVQSSSADPIDDVRGVRSLLLALQGLLAESTDVRLDERSQLTTGFNLGTYEFAQLVRVHGKPMQGPVITLPESPTLTATLRVASAWNDLVRRAVDERLALIDVFALVLRATHEIFFLDQAPRLGGYDLEYRQALAEVDAAARDCFDRIFRGDRLLLLHQHFLSWYQYVVPWQWNEAFFEADDILRFCTRLVETSRGTVAHSSPTRTYPNASLASGLRRVSSDAGRKEKVESFGWAGGYQVAVDALDIQLPANWDRLRQVFLRDRVARAAGPEAVALVLSKPTEDDSQAIDDSERLLSFATARLNNWANETAY